MLSIFLTSAYAPFAVTFVIMIGLGLIEAIGLGIGQFDVPADLDGDVEAGNVLGWLGFGEKLPILIWLTSFLACFTISGIAAQQIATSLTGEAVSWPVACLIAAGGAVALNRFAAKGLTRLMPGYESTSIRADDLVMRRGTILEGAARRGHPARARVIDQFKQAHYVMVEPHNDGDIIAQGETALLVRKEGVTFFAVPDVDTDLRSL